MMTSTGDERALLPWWNLLLIALALLLVVVVVLRELRHERLIEQRLADQKEEMLRQFERQMQERVKREVTAALAKVEQRVRVGLPSAAQKARVAVEQRNYGDALVSIEALQEALEVAKEAGAEVSSTEGALQELVQAIQSISPEVPQKAQQVLSQIEALAPST